MFVRTTVLWGATLIGGVLGADSAHAQPSLLGQYRCATERVYVSSCDAKCLVMYPDRPKPRGFTVQMSEDPTLLAQRLQVCRQEGQPARAGLAPSSPRPVDPIPPGKRLDGAFEQRNGLAVQFGPWVAQLYCGDAIGAYPYSVTDEGGHETVLIEAAPRPIRLVRRADGGFTGPLQATVTLRRSGSTSVSSLTPSFDSSGQAISSDPGAMRSTTFSVPSYTDVTVRCAAADLAPKRAK